METFLRSIGKYKKESAKGLLGLIGFFVSFLIATTLYAQELAPLFGPQVFTRETGKPEQVTHEVKTEGFEAPFAIRVENGLSDGTGRLSSAVIMINGVTVVGPSDFNQQVALIERPVVLGASNQLVVELRSKPGSRLAVTLLGKPAMPAVTKTIGPGGGVIELQGTKNKVTLDIPPGALGIPTEITIRQIETPPPDRFEDDVPKEGVPIGNYFSFEPHDLKFSKVVTVTFTYRDEDLPPDADEGRIFVYVNNGPDGRFDMEGGAICDPMEDPREDCVETESYAQGIDTDRNLASVSINTLSHRGLFQRLSSLITGCNGVRGAHPTELTLEAGGFRLPILRCLRPNVTDRPATSTISRVVVHSTNNGNVPRRFHDEIVCAITSSLCPGFAHYYIDRTGVIVQVTEDTATSPHTRPNSSLGVANANSIGIELFNNVGEPYDGRQITALIRLIDIQIRLHPTITTRGRTSIFSHAEVDTPKCDPVGIFRTSSEIVIVRPGPVCDVAPLSGGSPNASTLFDAVIAGVSAMGGDFPGLINTAGGDAFGLAQAGNGGKITFDGGEIIPLSSGTNFTDNTPVLIVPSGSIVSLSSGQYTNLIVDGRLELAGNADLGISGTIYIGPLGEIVSTDGGGSLTISANGTPLIQGVIDLRGKDSISGIGENGGVFSLATAVSVIPGPLLIPTLVSRGGDVHEAECPGRQVNPPVFCSFVAGSGGDINIIAAGDLIFSGTTSADPFFIPNLFSPRDLLFRVVDIDFKRGLLTSGGDGGFAVSSTGGEGDGGGTGGDGGDILLSSTEGKFVFRGNWYRHTYHL